MPLSVVPVTTQLSPAVMRKRAAYRLSIKRGRLSEVAVVWGDMS